MDMSSAVLSQERCTCCAVRNQIVIKCEVKSSADQKLFPDINARDFLQSTLAAALHNNHGYKDKVYMLQTPISRTKYNLQSVKQSKP